MEPSSLACVGAAPKVLLCRRYERDHVEAKWKGVALVELFMCDPKVLGDTSGYE